MRQKGRAGIPQRLLIALLASAAAVTAAAQITPIDFQVIHLPQTPAAPEKYVAIRTPEAWAALWSARSQLPNAPPIPNIDVKHFILLIANTGVKPSSGYSMVFKSVNTVPASWVAPTGKLVTLVNLMEIGPGSCPRAPELGNSVSYALIPQTTNEIRFTVTKADTDCTGSPVNPPFIK